MNKSQLSQDILSIVTMSESFQTPAILKRRSRTGMNLVTQTATETIDLWDVKLFFLDKMSKTGSTLSKESLPVKGEYFLLFNPIDSVGIEVSDVIDISGVEYVVSSYSTADNGAGFLFKVLCQ